MDIRDCTAEATQCKIKETGQQKGVRTCQSRQGVYDRKMKGFKSQCRWSGGLLRKRTRGPRTGLRERRYEVEAGRNRT
ncbi:hypothetical protein EVAR_2550_1 [Eumeta japonica]|uniref:Uncharacterized protein n=1 Tax=Eumeta variegata TaxID=151549 RepID=A0A4C1SRA8_EUMVA|nr:hypothetical protein EVAR_2550_1 [Eumeta japonica]